jgi:hypothetical protein
MKLPESDHAWGPSPPRAGTEGQSRLRWEPRWRRMHGMPSAFRRVRQAREALGCVRLRAAGPCSGIATRPN